MLSTRSLGCSANILALTREFTYICILHKSPLQKRKKIGFLLSWLDLDLDEEEILVKDLVHWTKWKLCLVHQCFSRYSQKVSLGFTLRPPTFSLFYKIVGLVL